MRRNSMKADHTEPLRIICLVKFVPDVDGFSYDYEHSRLNRSYQRMILNPDDACAVAFALQVKQAHPSAHIEVVTMAPRTVEPHLLDLLRLQIDTGVLITDPAFAGSDTYATTTVLETYLGGRSYDCILTGTCTLDGATSQVPAQLAQSLGLDHMQDITGIDLNSFDREQAVFTVEDDNDTYTYQMALPGILSLTRASGYKLPYIAYEDFTKDVSANLTVVTNQELRCPPEQIGLTGSLTQVVETFVPEHQRREHRTVQVDEDGIEYIYTMLKERGYV
jgi:electron transfer flavoprotein beta subunit